MRTAVRRSMLCPLIAAVCAGCLAPPAVNLDGQLLPDPLSKRGNRVLAHLFESCGSRSGRWSGQKNFSCADVWATQFCLQAGLRRGDQALVDAGRRTAAAVADDLRAVTSSTDPRLNGIAAMLASGLLDGRGHHYFMFHTFFEELTNGFDTLELDSRQTAGLCWLLAEVARADPVRFPRALELARRLAARTTTGPLAALAWSSLARATREETVIERAALLVETLVEPKESEVLSLRLAVAEACAELAMVTEDVIWSQRARRLVEHMFSDAFYVDGILAHHRDRDGASSSFCSGCNFHALYLLDRICGDSWRLQSPPPLPNRDLDQEGHVFDPPAEGVLLEQIRGLPPDCELQLRFKDSTVRLFVRYRIERTLEGARVLSGDVKKTWTNQRGKFLSTSAVFEGLKSPAVGESAELPQVGAGPLQGDIKYRLTLERTEREYLLKLAIERR